MKKRQATLTERLKGGPAQKKVKLESTSSFVSCPSCGKNVHIKNLDFHDCIPVAEQSQKTSKTTAAPEIFHMYFNRDVYSWDWHNEQSLTSFFSKKVLQSSIQAFVAQSPTKQSQKTLFDPTIDQQEQQVERQYYDPSQVWRDAALECGHTLESFDQITSTNESVGSVSVTEEPELCPDNSAENISITESSWKADVSVKLPTEAKHKFPITVDIARQDTDQTGEEWTMEKPKTAYSVSFLKSLIQKCVRNGKPDAAVRAAKELILRDFNEFIRRIPVIMVEDSFLHPGYPVIIWLMMAHSKGYKPTIADLEFCLQFTYDIAACEWRDFEWKWRKGNLSSQDLSKVVNTSNLSQLHPIEASLIKSILTRSAFGGMPCDTVMQNSHANIWAYRFLNMSGFKLPEYLEKMLPENIPVLKGLNYKLLFSDKNTDKLSPWMKFTIYAFSHTKRVAAWNKVGRLEKSDILLKAVDMHCYPILDKLFATDQFILSKCQEFMESKFQSSDPQDLSNKLKSMIWVFRSGPNTKQCVSGNDQSRIYDDEMRESVRPLWTSLCKSLDTISAVYARQKFETI